MKTITREQAIEELIADEYEKLNEGAIKQILYDGCTGWYNYDDEDLQDAYREYIDEDTEIIGKALSP